MAARAPRAWRTAADVRAAAERRWKDGTLLRAHARGEPFPTIDVPLGGPRAGEIGERFAEVQDWVAGLEAGSRRGARYELVYAEVGGRSVGRNRLPTRAVITDYAQAWAVLGAGADVADYDAMLAAVPADPDSPADPVRAWLLAKPLVALRYAPEWPQLLATLRWLEGARGSGRHLRQIDAPGVDTKFVERHRGVLGELLGVPAKPTEFLRGLGLAVKPEYVRMRAARGLLPLPASELSLRCDELPGLDVSVRTAVIVENEITYLTAPVPHDGVVIWGAGFDVARLGRWPALAEARVHYWGDLDTHGFAILNRLRAHLPGVESFLMDAQTLLAHRERWGGESTPTHAALPRLTPAEAAVYDDLVSDRYGERVRLEQERIDWAWAVEQLPYESAAL